VPRLVRLGRRSRVERVEVLAHRMRLRLAIRRPRLRHATAGQTLVAACVGVHLAAVHGRAFAGNKARLRAAAHHLLEHGTEHVAVAEAAMPVLAEGAVVRHDVVHAEAAEPAMRQVEVHPGAELPLGADAAEIADQQHTYHQLRIDRGTLDQAIVGRHDAADEGRVQQRVHRAEQVAGWKMVIDLNRGEHRLRHDPLAHHHCLHRTRKTNESQPLALS